jgi:hypothetical protein
MALELQCDAEVLREQMEADAKLMHIVMASLLHSLAYGSPVWA